jgi:hypothetical protein
MNIRCVSYVLSGLTAVDLADSSSLREARWALAQLDSAAGREPFSASLTPAYGVFYRGWLNWLRDGILSLQPAAARDPAETAAFERDSADLAAAFDESPTPFLAAYPGQAWWLRLPLLTIFVLVGAGPWLIAGIRRRRRAATSLSA